MYQVGITYSDMVEAVGIAGLAVGRAAGAVGAVEEAVEAGEASRVTLRVL